MQRWPPEREVLILLDVDVVSHTWMSVQISCVILRVCVFICMFVLCVVCVFVCVCVSLSVWESVSV